MIWHKDPDKGYEIGLCERFSYRSPSMIVWRAMNIAYIYYWDTGRCSPCQSRVLVWERNSSMHPIWNPYYHIMNSQWSSRTRVTYNCGANENHRNECEPNLRATNQSRIKSIGQEESTWYTSRILGRSGPIDPSFHPMINANQKQAPSCSLSAIFCFLVWRFGDFVI